MIDILKKHFKIISFSGCQKNMKDLVLIKYI